MSGVTDATREYVFRRAAYRCEYCQIRGWWLEPDHLIPRSRWHEFGGGPGLHDATNLAAACVPCNKRKRNHVTGIDPLTGVIFPLYNPRSPHNWWEHFDFTESFEEIIGISGIGQATVRRLWVNRRPYVEQRRTLRLAMLGGGPVWP